MVDAITTYHLVLGQDLNHHGTLFAGRAAEWFIEAGYLSATSILKSNALVCQEVQEFCFRKPVPAGETISFTASVVYAGLTSLVSYINAIIPSSQELILEGYIRFVFVDKNGKAQPHGLQIHADTEREKLLQNKAASLEQVPARYRQGIMT